MYNILSVHSDFTAPVGNSFGKQSPFSQLAKLNFSLESTYANMHFYVSEFDDVSYVQRCFQGIAGIILYTCLITISNNLYLLSKTEFGKWFSPTWAVRIRCYMPNQTGCIVMCRYMTSLHVSYIHP